MEGPLQSGAEGIDKRRSSRLVFWTITIGLLVYLVSPATFVFVFGPRSDLLLTIGLSGAVYCLIPGILCQSKGRMILGFLLGYVFGWLAFWGPPELIGLWDCRLGDNPLLRGFLPPGLHGPTHCGGSTSNLTKLAVGLSVWLTLMSLVWWALWRPRPDSECVMILVPLNIGLATAWAYTLWSLAPLNRLTIHPEEALQGWELSRMIVFVIVFLLVIPSVSVINALALEYLRTRHAKEQDAQIQNHI